MLFIVLLVLNVAVVEMQSAPVKCYEWQWLPHEWTSNIRRSETELKKWEPCDGGMGIKWCYWFRTDKVTLEEQRTLYYDLNNFFGGCYKPVSLFTYLVIIQIFYMTLI